MGLRFRKSVNLLPGVRLNVSKNGVSASFGKRGASVNVGKNGAYLNVGAPGTGLSYRQKIAGGNGNTSPTGNSGASGGSGCIVALRLIASQMALMTVVVVMCLVF